MKIKNTKGYKIYNFIMKIISWCVMAILVVTGGLLLTIVVLNKIADAKGELSPMGLYTIISPSMTPDIDVYDVVFVVRKDPNEIEIGDIISYYSTISSIGDIPVTHRVVEKFNTNTGVSFRTKGDANQVVDNEIVMGERVIGTVRLVIPFLGRIQFFLASKGGWFIAILIPALGIIVYDIVKLVKLLSVKNKMKQTTKTNNNVTIKNEKEHYNREENYSKIIDNYRQENNDIEDIKKTSKLEYDHNNYDKEVNEPYELKYKNSDINKSNKDKYYKESYNKKYEYPIKQKNDKKKKISYDEELNKLIDRLSEENERDLYAKKKSTYYNNKKSFKK